MAVLFPTLQPFPCQLFRIRWVESVMWFFASVVMGKENCFGLDVFL